MASGSDPEPWTRWEEQRTRPTLDAHVTKGRFQGRVAVVTGGASGIGRATVDRFLSDGATVAVVDIDTSAMNKMKEELSSQQISFYNLNVTDRQACFKDMENLAESKDGCIHHLVNCAAYFGSKGMDAVETDWRQTFDTNVMGFANMVQACVPHMKDSNCSIVNLASISSYQAQPNRWTYNSSKAAIAQLTKCMALDLSAKGIRVNAIGPAWIWTREVAKAAGGERDKYEPIWGPFHLLRRLGEVDECAAAATFLCSRDASFITGTVLMVDGGYSAVGGEGLGEQSFFAGSQLK